MKVVFFGSGAFGLPTLAALTSQTKVVQVVTSPDRPQGRGLQPAASRVKQWALEHSLPVTELARPGLDRFISEIPRTQADVFVVIAFGIILPQPLLDIPKTAALNVHASLLPAYRGPAPIQWALANGETETGVSVIRMVAKLDAGDILTQRRLLIADDDDSRTLHEKLAVLGAAALTDGLERLRQGQAVFIPQDERWATNAPKIKKEDGRVNWDADAPRIVNRVRAFAGWPGAYCFVKGKRLLLLSVRAEKGDDAAAVGSVVHASDQEGLVVAAKKDRVRLLSVQLEGRQAMIASEFLKGFPLGPGDRLE